MKKLITITLLLISFFAGGMTAEAKTTSKRKSSKTSYTKKSGKSSSSIPQNAIAEIFVNDMKGYLTKNGKVTFPGNKYSDYDGRHRYTSGGTYQEINGAYILEYQTDMGTEGFEMDIIYDDEIYSVMSGDMIDIDVEQLDSFSSIPSTYSYWEYKESNKSSALSFSPNSRTLGINTSRGKVNLKLSNLRKVGRVIKWY